MGKVKDLTGMKFGRWTVVECVGKDKRHNSLWGVVCDCGNKRILRTADLTSGRSRSCGCLNRELSAEANKTHGMGYTPTYNVWQHMKKRCYNPNSDSYHNYGGRGIRICERWLNSFENFLEDMGECPEGYSIDRIDNSGHYTPDNCRWATRSEQSRNKRNNTLITYKGETLCIAEWAERLGVRHSTISTRYRKGWTIEECLFGRTNSNSPQEDE